MRHNRAAQLAVTGGLLALFGWLIWQAGRAGYAGWLSTNAARVNQIALANAAVEHAPTDAEAHYVRGTILEAGDDLPEASAEYYQAASLRPDDFVLWLVLALAREQNGDRPGALAAARQAVPLAPYYAQPHWQLGNILVRAGQPDEGFKELRLAAASDPLMLPGIVEFAWQWSGGDAQRIKQALGPETPAAYLALAENFRKHGRTEEAIAMLGAAGGGEEALRARAQYLNELISAKRYPDAYRVWQQDHASASNQCPDRGCIDDGGFETTEEFAEAGFGWCIPKKIRTVTVGIDDSVAASGKRSLAIQFQGDSDSSAQLVTRLVLVRPSTGYRLSFKAKTRGIDTVARPLVFVIDTGLGSQAADPALLPLGTTDWQNFTMEFTTSDRTDAILLGVSRAACKYSSCPIFGALRLDDFALEKR